MPKIPAIFVIFAVSALARDIRVTVYDIGNAEHRDEAVAACWNEVAAIPGVKMLDDARSGVDYVILLSVRDAPGAVAISARVVERMDPGLSDRFYIKTDYKDEMNPVGDLVNLLHPLGQSELEVGPPESIKSMCHAIATAIDRETFSKERANPRGGSFDDAFQSFMVHLGYRRKASK